MSLGIALVLSIRLLQELNEPINGTCRKVSFEVIKFGTAVA